MATSDRRAFPALVAVLGLAVASCSGEPARPRVHPVHGTVTHRGRPAARAVVVLRPAAGPQPAASLPHGEVGEDGTFRVGTYRADDGAPAGAYVVTVTWPEKKSDPLTGDEVIGDRLRGRFADPAKSTLTVTVKEGDNELEPIRLD